MGLVTTKKMFQMAYKNGYAIGAFNVNNMEITRHYPGHRRRKAPLILPDLRGGNTPA